MFVEWGRQLYDTPPLPTYLLATVQTFRWVNSTEYFVNLGFFPPNSMLHHRVGPLNPYRANGDGHCCEWSCKCSCKAYIVCSVGNWKFWPANLFKFYMLQMKLYSALLRDGSAPFPPMDIMNRTRVKRFSSVAVFQLSTEHTIPYAAPMAACIHSPIDVMGQRFFHIGLIPHVETPSCAGCAVTMSSRVTHARPRLASNSRPPTELWTSLADSSCVMPTVIYRCFGNKAKNLLFHLHA